MNHQMNHQILIASYKKDFIWLEHALRSIDRFATGFLPPVVAVDFADIPECEKLVHDLGVLATVERFDGPGFARAQAAMMSGDILCPNADWVWVWGSDCIATRTVAPVDFYDAASGKPVMLHCDYYNSGPARFWQEGSNRALGRHAQFEFMRRLPLLYPKALFPATREAIRKIHPDRFVGPTPHEQFMNFMADAVNVRQNFSESNTLGAVAYSDFRDLYCWERTDLPTSKPYTQTPVLQFWSHGGLDRRMIDMDYVLPSGKHVRELTPREVLVDVGLLT